MNNHQREDTLEDMVINIVSHDKKIQNEGKYVTNPKGLQLNRLTSIEQNIHFDQGIQDFLDMNRVNCDWDFARLHGKATKPGLYDDNDHEECICCMRRVSRTLVPICQNSKELECLGYGFPLYFIFLKYVLILLLLHILNYSISQLYFAISANYNFCINGESFIVNQELIHCTSFMILLANFRFQITVIEKVIRLTGFIVVLIALLYFRDHLNKTCKYYRERKPGFSQFTIILSQLPSKTSLLCDHTNSTIGERIRNFFNDQSIFQTNLSIAKINLIGELNQIVGLQEKKKKVGMKLGELHKNIKQLQLKMKGNRAINEFADNISKHNMTKKELKDKLKAIKGSIAQQKQRLKQLVQNEDIDCQNAIVCFEVVEDKTEVLNTEVSSKQYQKHFGKEGRYIVIKQAPEPKQIAWQNIGIDEMVKGRRKLSAWVLFVIILSILTVGIYFLFTFLVHEIDVVQSQNIKTFIIFFYLVSIIVFNKFVLASIIHHLVDIEIHQTGQSSQFSFMLKYSLGLFFTTAVLTLIVDGVINNNIYTKKYGIIEEETIMFFFIAFLVPFIWLVNPWHLWKLIQRKKYQNSPFLIQEEANKLMEDPEYIMGKRYGQILEALWFTFLYASVIPLGTILCFIGVSLYYWIDKYNLLRKSSLTQALSESLCMKTFYLLEFVLIIKPAGQLIFNHLCRHQFSWIPVVEIIIGAIYLILPIEKILNRFHHQTFISAQMKYTQLKERNALSYELFSPLTKEEELKVNFENVEKKSNMSIKYREINKVEKGKRGKKRKLSISKPNIPKRSSKLPNIQVISQNFMNCMLEDRPL